MVSSLLFAQNKQNTLLSVTSRGRSPLTLRGSSPGLQCGNALVTIDLDGREAMRRLDEDLHHLRSSATNGATGLGVQSLQQNKPCKLAAIGSALEMLLVL